VFYDPGSQVGDVNMIGSQYRPRYKDEYGDPDRRYNRDGDNARRAEDQVDNAAAKNTILSKNELPSS
jgi:hypothetical protein